ncbi:MAG: hypothetical protein ACK54H_09640 [Phycisphaerales bacterium]
MTRQAPHNAERCPRCGAPGAGVIWVHGHGQCARCGANIMPCCQPEPPEPDEGESAGHDPEYRSNRREQNDD